MSFKIYTHLFFIMVLNSLNGQNPLSQAQKIIDENRFDTALEILNNINDIESNSKALQLRGSCFFMLNHLDKAVYDFTASKKLGNDDPDLFFKMGQCKQHLGEFEEAIFFYKSFLSQVGDNNENTYKAYLEMKNAIYCATHKDTSDILVQNFGSDVNTPLDDIMVIQSPQFGNAYYLSSNNESTDINICAYTLDSLGQWLHSNVQSASSKGNTIIQDISPNGNGMLYTNHSEKGSDHIVSCFHEGRPLMINLPDRLFRDVIDIQIVNQNTLAFASDREGGYGGFDIYTIRYENGIWQSAVNLGPGINTSHDERAPHLAKDQSRFYFSSNRPYCYGGFDIYHGVRNSNKIEISNLGSTVNSPGDDLGFRICKDGNMAVFYSNRKTGIGGFDAYFAYMQNPGFKKYTDSLDLIFIQDHINALKYETITEQTEKIILPVEETQTTDSEDVVITRIENEAVPMEQIPEYRPIEIPADLEYSLLYQDKLDLLNEINKAKIDHWISYLKENVDRDIKLLAYTDHSEPGLPEFVQYNTLKRALYVADYMIDQGIPENRISVESLANNYPIVKRESAGKINTIHLKYNKRIDLELVDKHKQTLSSYTLEELIPDYAYDRRNELFLSIREGLYYSIEISETNRLFKNAVLRLYSDIYIRKEDMSELNKYYIGIYTKYKDAQKLLSELKESSAPYARIVPFFNGTPITTDNIIQLKKNHPELSAFNL